MLSLASKHWPGADARLHAAGAQVAFRFNSFIALALSERLGGPPALAWTALMIALCMPIWNVAAGSALARHGGHSCGRELVRNPLILSTLGGLLALPVGLMAVGAGLRLGGLKSAPWLAAALLALRHAVLPPIAIGLSAVLARPAEPRVVVLRFAALPTASSACVLAARRGGDGRYSAGLVSLSTLLGMVSIPVWLAALAGLQ